MLVLERKGCEVFYNNKQLKINTQSSKGPNKEVVWVGDLEDANGQQWVSLSKLKEGINEIECKKRVIKNGHISRLRQGDCTMELGFILSDLLTNYERISDHCSNIAVCFIEIAHDSFETHEYLKQIKSGGADFDEMFELYYNQYLIGNIQINDNSFLSFGCTPPKNNRFIFCSFFCIFFC